jgi:hypothetical protein
VNSVSDADQVTPGWLTDVLRTHGSLHRGSVTGVHIVGSFEPPPSLMTRLEVTYSADSPGLPSRLLLKIPKAERLPASNREVVFYRDIAPAMDPSPAVRCLDAAYDADTGAYHLLIEDTSETRRAMPWPCPFYRAHAEGAIDALAKLHATYWDDPRVGVEFGDVLTPEHIRVEWATRSEQLPDFLGRLADWITPEWRSAYERVFDVFPEPLIDRIESGGHLTLIHGDTHAANFLVPHDPNSRDVRIIDWMTYHRSFGVRDVAYLMTKWWRPRVRRMMERDLVERYHARLVEHGVSEYDLDTCWRDYRLTVIETVLHTVAIPIPWDIAWLWYPAFEQTMSAFEDLDCMALLA